MALINERFQADGIAELSGWSKRTIEKWDGGGKVMRPDMLHLPRAGVGVGLPVALTAILVLLKDMPPADDHENRPPSPMNTQLKSFARAAAHGQDCRTQRMTL